MQEKINKIYNKLERRNKTILIFNNMIPYVENLPQKIK